MFVQTHVCIQQTVIDLLERGLEVHVVADATSSRSQMDRLLALQASTCSTAQSAAVVNHHQQKADT